MASRASGSARSRPRPSRAFATLCGPAAFAISSTTETGGTARWPATEALSAATVHTVELVQPGHTNPHGTVFGGQVVQWIDLAASLAAQRHCRQTVVTAAIDALSFRAPIHVGEWALLSAVVNRTWHSSLEVQVAVEAEHPLTGMRRRAVDAFLTFVALGDDGRPVEVPTFVPSTAEEQTRWEGAEARRVARLALRSGSVGDRRAVP